ncbi:MAG: phosphoglycerate mutase family protein, partial [Planctomycetales bacterium]
MLKVLLIRPGTTEFDLQGRIMGNLDVPLCEQGDDEVTKMIQTMNGQIVDAVFSSPSESAIQTADRICEKWPVKSKALDQLTNLNHGLWQGMLVDEVKRKQPKVFRQWQEHPETVCPPEGEMLEVARKRIESVISRLLKKHTDSTVALVAPEPLASIIVSVLRHTE